MTRLTVCAALALALTASAAFAAQEAAQGADDSAAAEQKFKAMDKDGDGALTLQEWVGDKVGEEATTARAEFAAKDTNKDGKLTLAECKAKKQEQPAP